MKKRKPLKKYLLLNLVENLPKHIMKGYVIVHTTNELYAPSSFVCDSIMLFPTIYTNNILCVYEDEIEDQCNNLNTLKTKYWDKFI